MGGEGMEGGEGDDAPQEGRFLNGYYCTIPSKQGPTEVLE